MKMYRNLNYHFNVTCELVLNSYPSYSQINGGNDVGNLIVFD